MPKLLGTSLTISSQSYPQNPEIERCTSQPDVSYANLLSFLAHLHHQVDQVGKLPPKPLDMNKVNRMIEKSHEIMTHGFSSCDLVVLGSGSSTQSTPLQLNDMSFDLEWKSLLPSVMNKNKHHTKDTISGDVDSILGDFTYGVDEPKPSSGSLAERFLKGSYECQFKYDHP